MTTFEYPDPVVAAYIDGVRALPALNDDRDWRQMCRHARATLNWWQRAASHVLENLVVLIHEFQVLSSIWFIPDRAARRTYRALHRDLRAAGWGITRRVSISHGLTAVRHRGTGPAMGLYDRTMGIDIPRSGIGWV